MSVVHVTATMAENTFPVYGSDAILNFFRTEVLTDLEARQFSKGDLLPVPKVTSVTVVYFLRQQCSASGRCDVICLRFEKKNSARSTRVTTQTQNLKTKLSEQVTKVALCRCLVAATLDRRVLPRGSEGVKLCFQMHNTRRMGECMSNKVVQIFQLLWMQVLFIYHRNQTLNSNFKQSKTNKSLIATICIVPLHSIEHHRLHLAPSHTHIHTHASVLRGDVPCCNGKIQFEVSVLQNACDPISPWLQN